MSRKKILVSLGSFTWVALTAVLPLGAQAQSDSSQLGIPDETALTIITRMSDTVATRIKVSSCEDTRELLNDLRKSKGKSSNELSVEGQLLATAQSQPKVKEVVANRIGTALALKLMDCDMLTPDTLTTLFDPK
ncbi:MAG: hypothetical protein HC851_15920 [Acaryochloris sp. RU_4_1]|nr:hypothetical protein [Acaryochloris sp. SU_5_25]NJM67040.1 hypothetical protein [Acaryochloris sp. RU_4_1]NJR55993.1 hypothetical protein [Acaryochloris sp. CRU_2_0]